MLCARDRRGRSRVVRRLGESRLGEQCSVEGFQAAAQARFRLALQRAVRLEQRGEPLAAKASNAAAVDAVPVEHAHEGFRGGSIEGRADDPAAQVGLGAWALRPPVRHAANLLAVASARSILPRRGERSGGQEPSLGRQAGLVNGSRGSALGRRHHHRCCGGLAVLGGHRHRRHALAPAEGGRPWTRDPGSHRSGANSPRYSAIALFICQPATSPFHCANRCVCRHISTVGLGKHRFGPVETGNEHGAGL